MSWRDRSRLRRLAALAASAWLLAACGYQPLYGGRAAGPATTPQFAEIAVDNIPERTGQILRNELLDRLSGTTGRPGTPAYHLAVELTQFEIPLSYQKNTTSTRAQLTVIAQFKLIDAQTGAAALVSAAQTVQSYDVLESQYGTLVTQQDAYRRALDQIADAITRDLALFFSRRASPT